MATLMAMRVPHVVVGTLAAGLYRDGEDEWLAAHVLGVEGWWWLGRRRDGTPVQMRMGERKGDSNGVRLSLALPAHTWRFCAQHACVCVCVCACVCVWMQTCGGRR